MTDDAIRSLIISHHLLDTREIILIHHTRCGMLAFTDDLLKAGLEGDPAAEKLLGQATSRAFTSSKKGAVTPAQFHAFRGPIEPLDAPRDAKNVERLSWDVRRGMSSILNHPWIPTSGPDAITVRGLRARERADRQQVAPDRDQRDARDERAEEVHAEHRANEVRVARARAEREARSVGE